jgi:hypothetical protein
MQIYVNNLGAVGERGGQLGCHLHSLPVSRWYTVVYTHRSVVQKGARAIDTSTQSKDIYRIPQCMSRPVGIETLPPFSRRRVCPSPRNPRGGGANSPAGEGLGESQFRRLEKKLITLPTLCNVHR